MEIEVNTGCWPGCERQTRILTPGPRWVWCFLLQINSTISTHLGSGMENTPWPPTHGSQTFFSKFLQMAARVREWNQDCLDFRELGSLGRTPATATLAGVTKKDRKSTDTSARSSRTLGYKPLRKSSPLCYLPHQLPFQATDQKRDR